MIKRILCFSNPAYDKEKNADDKNRLRFLIVNEQFEGYTQPL